MRKVVSKQLKKRKLYFYKNEISLVSLIFLTRNSLISKIIRQNQGFNFQKLSFYFKTKFFKFCFSSGRVRGVVPKLNLSRQLFRQNLADQNLPGFFYSS